MGSIFSKTFEFTLPSCHPNTAPIERVWEKEGVFAFNELMVSWNGMRPEKGKWTFWVSLRQNEKWSDWLKYAEWSSSSQRTFSSQSSSAHTFQDGAFPKSDFCNGFRIKAIGEERADLNRLDAIFVCISNLEKKPEIKTGGLWDSIFLSDASRLSQMALDHPRAKDLCSPTSTVNALNFLLRSPIASPIDFASKIHDDGFDIYGNWVLNTAQAYVESNGAYKCHIERLGGFEDIHAHLSQGLPVVVSIRGPIPGSAESYHSGHLICVIGYDSKERKVICIDPAFPSDESTLTHYALDDFLTAWSRRSFVAYVFPPKKPNLLTALHHKGGVSIKL